MTKTLKKIATSVSTGVTALTIAATPIMAATTGLENTTIEKPTGFFDDIGDVINSLLKFVMVIAALLVFLYLIWGGIEWITSGGDKGKTESARNKITSAIIGLIVLAASYALLTIVLKFIGFDDGIDGVFKSMGNN